MATFLDELMHMTPGRASSQEVREVHFSKWGEGNPGALWGKVVDMVKGMKTAPCHCKILFERCSSLRNELHHVIFKHPDQWRSAFSHEVAQLLEGNARG